MKQVKRREVLAVFGAVVAWPLAVHAQQEAKVWRIGFLTPRSRPNSPASDAFSDAFMRGMSDLGYREGKNLAIEWRYANGDYTILRGYAAELAAMELAVIVTYGTAAARALKGVTGTRPVVVAAAVDLVGAGIVESLARPGGNITGLSVIDVDISGKQLELLKTFSPSLSRVAVLLNPGNPAHPTVLKHLEGVAPSVNIDVLAANAATPPAIETALAEAAVKGAGAVIVAADAFFSGQGQQIAASALQHRLPTISLYQDHAVAGCLLSYGQDVAQFHRRAALYVDRIFKGAKPEELPVEQPTKFDLVVNSKTASALGLAVPQTLLVTADRVIE
jgi:putative ABC transport system substrate-binding protein